MYGGKKGKGKGGAFTTTPDKAAPGFPEKDYKESLKSDPPNSDRTGSGSSSIGPENPGYPG